jgi:hypothetical protein
MCLCKLKIQINKGPKGFVKERENGHAMKSKKDRRRIYLFIKFQMKNKSCVKKIFKPIKGCKHPLIASGATPIGSTCRAPDEIKTRR